MRNKLECVPAFVFFFVVSLVPCPYVCAYACTVTSFFSYLRKHEGASEKLHGSWLKCVCVFSSCVVCFDCDRIKNGPTNARYTFLLLLILLYYYYCLSAIICSIFTNPSALFFPSSFFSLYFSFLRYFFCSRL